MLLTATGINESTMPYQHEPQDATFEEILYRALQHAQDIQQQPAGEAKQSVEDLVNRVRMTRNAVLNGLECLQEATRVAAGFWQVVEPESLVVNPNLIERSATPITDSPEPSYASLQQTAGPSRDTWNCEGMLPSSPSNGPPHDGSSYMGSCDSLDNLSSYSSYDLYNYALQGDVSQVTEQPGELSNDSRSMGLHNSPMQSASNDLASTSNPMEMTGGSLGFVHGYLHSACHPLQTSCGFQPSLCPIAECEHKKDKGKGKCKERSAMSLEGILNHDS